MASQTTHTVLLKNSAYSLLPVLGCPNVVTRTSTRLKLNFSHNAHRSATAAPIEWPTTWVVTLVPYLLMRRPTAAVTSFFTSLSAHSLWKPAWILAPSAPGNGNGYFVFQPAKSNTQFFKSSEFVPLNENYKTWLESVSHCHCESQCKRCGLQRAKKG